MNDKPQLNYFLIFFHRLSNLKQDTSIWLDRPLKPELDIGAARSVAYLLDLQWATRTVMNSPFYAAVDNLLSDVRDADAMDAALKLHSEETLPATVVEVLPDLRPDKYRAEKFGPVEGRFVHQCVGQMDPNVIFSRDCLHQNKVMARGGTKRGKW